MSVLRSELYSRSKRIKKLFLSTAIISLLVASEGFASAGQMRSLKTAGISNPTQEEAQYVFAPGANSKERIGKLKTNLNAYEAEKARPGGQNVTLEGFLERGQMAAPAPPPV